MRVVALTPTTRANPAASLLRVKAVLAGVDLAALRAVLAALRRNAAGQASLRDPLASWSREHGHDA